MAMAHNSYHSEGYLDEFGLFRFVMTYKTATSGWCNLRAAGVEARVQEIHKPNGQACLSCLRLRFPVLSQHA